MLRLSSYLPFFLLPGLMLLGGCHHDHHHDHDDHPDHTMEWQDTLRIPVEVLRLAGAKWGMPEPQARVDGEKLFGEWALFPEYRAEVSGIAPGRVKRIRYQLNEVVTIGAPLVELESREWMDLQRQYFDLKARGVYLQQEHERLRNLRDQDATSLKAWQQIEAEMAAWRATLASIAADIRLHGVDPDALDPARPQVSYTLKAPITGQITHSRVSPGQWLETGTAACVLADLRQIHVTLQAYPRQLTSLRPGDTLWLETEGYDQVIPSRIRHIDALTAPGSQTLGVHAMPLTSVGLPAVGSFVQAYAVTTVDTQLLALPERAVRLEEGRSFILLYLPGESGEGVSVFLRRTVDIRRRSGDRVIVTRPPGWTESTPVVLEGAYYLHAHSMSEAFEHDH
jgi:cobalt-zinc-cadmium efflux system membrane fusion protein